MTESYIRGAPMEAILALAGGKVQRHQCDQEKFGQALAASDASVSPSVKEIAALSATDSLIHKLEVGNLSYTEFHKVLKDSKFKSMLEKGDDSSVSDIIRAGKMKKPKVVDNESKKENRKRATSLLSNDVGQDLAPLPSNTPLPTGVISHLCHTPVPCHTPASEIMMKEQSLAANLSPLSQRIRSISDQDLRSYCKLPSLPQHVYYQEYKQSQAMYR